MPCCIAVPSLCYVTSIGVLITLIPNSAAAKLTTRTKAVIPVHLFGLCADIDALRAVLPADVCIVEDAACAAGASYKGTPAGGLGDAGCFSFHPRKSITCGEGGMLVTSDLNIAARVDVLRNHGASISEEQRRHGPQPYLLASFDELGFNYRMTDIQAAIGTVQLTKLDRFIDERARWARYYREQLTTIDWLSHPIVPNDGRHAWQAYVTYIDPQSTPLPRNEIMRRLHDLGVATRPGTHAVHTLGYYRNRFGYQPDDLPGARDCERNTMAIPLHNRMLDEDYAYVVGCLHRIARDA